MNLPSKFNCYVSPKKVIKWFLLLLCMCVSIYQLMMCIKKIKQPPVSTHYNFGLNNTLNYPAITVCRNPAYKKHILQEFNLGLMNSGMEVTSQWDNFPFQKSSLQEVWNKATYSLKELIPMYGLHGLRDNVVIANSFYYLQGQCFTLIPKVGETKLGPTTGWSLMLAHDVTKNNNEATNLTSLKSSVNSLSGFHVFIHHIREPYFENKLQVQSIMEYFYLEVGEEIEIKISAEQLKQIPSTNRPCVQDENYSAAECAEMLRWEDIGKKAKCSAPWMSKLRLPHCNNAPQLKYLIKKYLLFDDNGNQGCNRSCSSTVYKLFVVNRVSNGKSNISNMFIYYSSKLVTVMEEIHGYDWNSFIADIGGSLGFFLGISVIGIIGIFENFVKFICRSPKIAEEIASKELEKARSHSLHLQDVNSLPDYDSVVTKKDNLYDHSACPAYKL